MSKESGVILVIGGRSAGKRESVKQALATIAAENPGVIIVTEDISNVPEPTEPACKDTLELTGKLLLRLSEPNQ